MFPIPKMYAGQKIIKSPIIIAKDLPPAIDMDSKEGTQQKIDYSWLPFAAKTYKISDKIEDYVLKTIPLFPTGLPNRNGIGFALPDIIEYRPPPINRQVYKSWIGCPTHLEHANEDYTEAKGVIFDTVIKPIKNFGNGNFHKVMGLIGFCKKKDASLAEKVLNNKIRAGSMGAYCNTYVCSICGVEAFNEANMNCAHIKSAKDINWRIIERGGKNELAFLWAKGISPIEFSAVEDPAWVPAISDVVFEF